MKKYIFIVILNFINFSNQLPGYLGLDPSDPNKCTICDNSNFYYKQADQCLLLNNSDCLKIDENGNCTICGNEKFPDDQNCQNRTQPVISDCLGYSSDSQCERCNIGTYLN